MSSMKRFRTACETKTKGLCGRLTINFHERHHSLLGIGGEDQKMEAKEANSDKANGTSSSAAAPSSSFPSSQTTPTTKPDESTAADVRICAEMIAAACIKMAAISQSTYQLKSGSSSGEDGDDETDWKQPLIPKRRVLQKRNKSRRRTQYKKK